MRVMLTGKTYSKYLKKVRAKNRNFAKKSRKEQRITIAKDVIAMLSTKKIEAGSTYLALEEALEDKVFKNTSYAAGAYYWDDAGKGDGSCDDADASAVMAQTSCTVCGIGSLFVSALQNNDKMKLNQFTKLLKEDTRDGEVQYLKKWFDAEQLNLVERFYEQRGGSDTWESPIHAEPNDNKRLKMIMQNIVSNGGKFDPDKGEHKNVPNEDDY